MLRRGSRKIGFYAEGPVFDGGTLDKSALGGSETALIQAARALADRGHEVIVFNNCSRPGFYDGVKYVDRGKLGVEAGGLNFDIFIVSRFFGFLSVPVRSEIKVLWNHDTLDKPGDFRAVAGRADIIMVLSRFHRDNYLTRVPEIAERIFITRNGIDTKLLVEARRSAKKMKNKLIYASRPERGLAILLEQIWPRLLEARPDLELYLCGYDVDSDHMDPALAGLYGRLKELAAKSKNVIRLGSLPKKEYYRHLAESRLMLYPCIFPEISCIAALESQACETPVVASDRFALSETVCTAETRIPGRPGTGEYIERFVEKTLELIGNNGMTDELAGCAGESMVLNYSWESIVAEWDRLFDLSLAARGRRASIGLRKEMMHYGRRI